MNNPNFRPHLALLGALCFECACSKSSDAPESFSASGSAGMSSTSGGSASLGGAGAGTTGGGAPPGGSAGTSIAGASGDAGEPAAVLELSANELVFSAVRMTRSPAQTLRMTNASNAPLEVATLALDAAAPDTAAFEITSSPSTPFSLAARESMTVDLVFEPAAAGVFESALELSAPSLPGVQVVRLFGLGMQGLEGNNEPALALIVETLGFAVDVGGDELHLGTAEPLLGEEVPAQLFRALGPGPVELVPVARYSPAERLPYGYYTPQGEIEHNAIVTDAFQTLYPAVEQPAVTTFDPPQGSFGIFTRSELRNTYSEDEKNVGNPTTHAVRTYPLKDRSGTIVPGAYLVCFEEAANGDYQDYVFTLRNVEPVP